MNNGTTNFSKRKPLDKHEYTRGLIEGYAYSLIERECDHYWTREDYGQIVCDDCGEVIEAQVW